MSDAPEADGQTAPRFDPQAAKASSQGAQWLTVSQAARALGVSERQARRYAARLSPADRQEEANTVSDMTAKKPDMTREEAGHITPKRPAKRPARVRSEAMKAARDASSKREVVQNEPDNTSGHEAGHAPDITTKEPHTTTEGAGHMTDAVSVQAFEAPTDWKQREADFREEVRFLRGLVEQRDRDAAELRAALREALKAQPRQLEAPSAQPETVQERAQIATPTNTASPTPEAVKAPQNAEGAAPMKEPRPLWKVVLGIR